MKFLSYLSLSILILSVVSCQGQTDLEVNKTKPQKKVSENLASAETKGWIDPNGMTVKDRILLPEGFERSTIKTGSFHEYLLNHPLQPDGARVKLYDGSEKIVYDVYCAVFDQDIGTKNLHQCADAVMNLRASYFYENKEYDKIHFNFTSGDRADYKKYAEGYRASIKGSKVSWVKKANRDYSEKTFRKYMELIYSYCGTASLSKEMVEIGLKDIQPGDVFILGGHPGHAVLVLDVVTNSEGGKAFLLSQSYMPAQQSQILINPKSNDQSPWYFVKDLTDGLETPEWSFELNQLMRFQN
jgi:hypothetical protein